MEEQGLHYHVDAGTLHLHGFPYDASVFGSDALFVILAQTGQLTLVLRRQRHSGDSAPSLIPLRCRRRPGFGSSSLESSPSKEKLTAKHTQVRGIIQIGKKSWLVHTCRKFVHCCHTFLNISRHLRTELKVILPGRLCTSNICSQSAHLALNFLSSAILIHFFLSPGFFFFFSRASRKNFT